MTGNTDHEGRPADRAFVDQIRSWLREHWPAASPSASLRLEARARLRFIHALADCGWLVPHWPVAEGGTGWSRRQQYLFARELARAGAPDPDGFTINVVGPLLIRAGARAWRERHLELIRTGRERWCAHGSVLGGALPVLIRDRTGYRLDRPSLHAHGACQAQWLLLLANDAGAALLLAVPLAAARVDPGLPLDPDRILLDHGRLADAAPIGEAGEGRALLVAVQAEADELATAPASALALRFAALRAVLGSDELAPLGVDLLGLQALEARAQLVDEPVLEGDRNSLQALRSMLRIRSRTLGRRLAEQALSAAGYYALPSPDPLTTDNEGPVGERWTQDAMADLIGYVGGPGDTADRAKIAALQQTSDHRNNDQDND